MKTSLLRVLLAALCALPFSLQAAPKPVRLFEIYVIRVVPDGSGFQTVERGLLDSYNHFRVLELAGLPPGVTAPAEVLNRPLVTLQAWTAYDALGADAFANFEVTGGVITLGTQGYFPVAVSEDARFDLGDVVNISTRATVTPGADPVIGGFVVEGMHRWVLIRGVGPGLTALGVAEPLPDPYITVHKGGTTPAVLFNDNWGERPDAAEIVAVSKRLGAFDLPVGSKDAAYLVELEPGAYTVHLTTMGNTGGTALVEVYVLP